jgi:hypothetical protein
VEELDVAVAFVGEEAA